MMRCRIWSQEAQMVGTLMRWAAERGYHVGWGLSSAIEAAREDVLSRRRSGELDPGFFEAALAGFGSFEAPWEGPATVVVVVMPRPAHTVAFTVDGRQVETVFPPTYVRYKPLFDEVRTDLQEHGLPGARVERLNVPLKSLAARVGLVRFGRTNVTYDPVFGSYLQLFGYLTDARLPLPAEWRSREPELLPECEGCSVCLAACPTGAIGEDRVLLHGERCLTVVNENPGEWPRWIPSSAHNCIIGCLLCQRPCPANPKLPVERTGVVFTAEETEALLGDGSTHEGQVWEGIKAKLERLGLPDQEQQVLGRNLRALVQARALEIAR
jgi:epoxyqueuosine reductase